MYPDQELRRLAVQKAALQREIALRRAECMEAAANVARPLEWLDKALAFWRKISPMVHLSAIPLGFLAKRALFPRFKVLGSIARWGPLVFGAVRGMSSLAKDSPKSR
jgi:hypothetical protein